MRHTELIQQLLDDTDYVSELNPDFSKLDSGWEKWGIGDRLCWCYDEDAKFWKEEFKHEYRKIGFDSWLGDFVRNNGNCYKGVLFVLPDTEGFQIDNEAILCIYSYPCEKCSPESYWISFCRFLENKDLYKVWKI